MERETVHDLANRLMDGSLDQKIHAWRAQGLSLNLIARRLDAEHNIRVTSETVRRWLNRAAPLTTKKAS